MSTAPLLIELGCEELPAAQISSLSQQLSDGIRQTLIDHDLVADTQAVEIFATPRRLAVLIDAVAPQQATQTIERKGPALAAAFDANGQPTKAAQGFASSVGLTVDTLDRVVTEQGEWLGATIEQPGRSLEEILQEGLVRVVNDMASARSMRWRQGDESFIRPVRWLVAMHGPAVLPLTLFGLMAGQQTWGHRIHAHGPLSLQTATDYEKTLEQAHVIASESKRRAVIAEQVHTLASHQQWVLDEKSFVGLLTENTQLTEWPQAVLGSFDPSFLVVPEPALISAMELHQKCFALRAASGELTPHFVAVANIESQDIEAMRAGFEWVIRPRLADAQFFWDQDKQTPLSARQSQLGSVLFQKDLGSLAQKAQRLATLVTALAEAFSVDPKQAQQAAHLAKCDLLTDMVGEFPELQGTMGYYYALEEGIGEEVAKAIEGHYQPRNPADHLPTTTLGQALAVADRADTLMGIFGVGLKPKGNKDPFALRRAALGLIRLLEQQPALHLRDVLYDAGQGLGPQLGWSATDVAQQVDEVFEFCMDRARSYALDQQIQTLTFNATVAVEMTSVADLMMRSHAVERLLQHPDIDSLIAANKRLANLLDQQQASSDAVDPSRFVEAEETALFDVWMAKQDLIAQHTKAHDYDGALKELASLARPLDAYFEKVMVMSDDLTLRQNRLALLSQMRSAFLTIADLAKLGR